MASAYSPTVDLPVIRSAEAAEPRSPAARTPGAVRRGLSIAGAGSVIFVAMVTAGSQLVSQAWVASHFGW